MTKFDIICFDFETCSRNPHKTQLTQIAALALDGRNFKVKGEFNSEVRPIFDEEKAIAAGFDAVEEEALRVTKKTREELEKAPGPKVVWQKFTEFVNKHNWKGTSYFAPIAAGYNINGFDMPIVQRMCELYGPLDKRGRQALFNPIFTIDMMQHIHCWFEGNSDVKGYSMDYLRDYFGMSQESKDNAHDALQDVKDTANIMIKFLKLQRNLLKKIKFEKAFANGISYIE